MTATASTQVPKTRRMRPARAMLIVLAGLVAVWMVVPTLAVVPLSFTGAPSFQFPPNSWSTQWYSNVFADRTWFSAFTTSLAIAVISSVVATVLGTTAALGMRTAFIGRQVVYVLLVAPMVVPVVIFAVAVYAVFLPWGLTGTIPGFVAAHCVLGIPFVFVTVAAGLQNFDPRLAHAAANLGATPLRAFRSVTLPLIAPSVLTGALFAFMASFDEAVVSLFLVTPSRRTLPVGMYEGVTREIDPTVAAVASIMLVTTTLLLIIGVLIHARRSASNE